MRRAGIARPYIRSGIIGAMGSTAPDELLLDGRQALADGDWEVARACFERAVELRRAPRPSKA